MAKASKSSKTAEKKAAAAALLEAQTAIKNQLQTAKACCATTAIAPFKHVERKGTPKMTVTVVANAAKGASMLAEASALVERNALPVALAGAGLNGGVSSPESEGAPSLKKKTHQLVMGANDEESQFLLAHSSDAADPAAAVDAENVDPKAGGALMGFVRYRFVIEESVPVMYVHEIQVAPNAQRKGVGKMLTMLTEVVAKKAGVKGVVLKVPKANSAAAAFYLAAKYVVSPLSPSKVNPWAEEKENDHELMEKIWDQDAKIRLATRAGEIRGANEKALAASGKKSGHGDADGDLSWTTGRY